MIYTFAVSTRLTVGLRACHAGICTDQSLQEPAGQSPSSFLPKALRSTIEASADMVLSFILIQNRQYAAPMPDDRESPNHLR